jgi:hypothetical protein
VRLEQPDRPEQQVLPELRVHREKRETRAILVRRVLLEPRAPQVLPALREILVKPALLALLALLVLLVRLGRKVLRVIPGTLVLRDLLALLELRAQRAQLALLGRLDLE